MAVTGVQALRRYLLTVAGPDRTPRYNLQLASLLALNAGVLNSVGFAAVAVYTSHMTGVTSIVADELVLGGTAVALLGMLAVATFVAGAATCAVVFNWGRRRGLRGRYANVLVAEALLILLFGLMADSLTWAPREPVYITVLCFTMGMQNAVITKISSAQIRTTHVTGMITDIGIELGKLAYVPRRAGLPAVTANTRKLGMLTMLTGLFFLGGVLGAWGYLVAEFAVVIPLALLLLTAAGAPVLADLRALRGRPGRPGRPGR